MNDKETLKHMFDSAKVVYEEDSSGEACPTRARRSNLIVYQISSSYANSGYTFFFTTFEFDDKGALLAIGAWE